MLTATGGLFNFGDGAGSQSLTGTVTSINQAEDWVTETFKVQHTYSTAKAQYTAYFYDTNRISTLKLGHDLPEYISTLVTDYSNGTPVASVPAILAVPLQNTTSFDLGSVVTDIDPNVNVEFRMSTLGEMFGTSVNGISVVAFPSGIAYTQNGKNSGTPPGFSISTPGIVTWDETQIAPAIANGNCGFGTPKAGDLWAAQVMAHAVDKTTGAVVTQIPIDLLLRFVNPVGALPTISLSPSGPQTVSVGTPVTFAVVGSSTNAGAKITLNASGVPAGATATGLNAAVTPPTQSTFNWTPASNQYGTFVVTYTATDNNLQQVTASESIIVASLPTATCGPTVTTAYGAPASVSAAVFDQNNEVLDIAWSVDGNSVHTDSGILAYPASKTLTYSQDFGSVGNHAVAVVATDPHGVTASCSTSVTVNPADQTITFGTLPGVTYGAADFNVAASSTSNQPVSFAAAGSCAMIGGNTVHVTGVGVCTVTASQAGNSNYNAALPVSQQFTISPQALTVTANNGTRVYGAADPAFTGTISGIVNNDAITATYAANDTTASSVGTYAIVPTLSGAALSNYTVTTNNGTLTVTPASLTVTANNATRQYGAGNPAFTGTIVGIANNDAITATYSSSATAASAVGNYTIVPALSGSALSNYMVTANNGTLMITAAPLVVTAADASRSYGAANPVFTGSITGTQNNDPITASYSTAATAASDPGSYAIIPQLNDPQNKLANYNVTLNTATLTIVKANQVISWATPAAITYATPLSSAQLNAGVTVPGPAIAGAVTYSPATGTVLNAGLQTLMVSVAGTTDYNPATATVQLMVDKAQTSFAGLKNVTLVYHTSVVTFTGVLTSPSAIPAGQQVAIEVNNVTQNAVVASNGSFSATFITAALPVAANGYTVSYSYGGSNDFTPASATSSLAVGYAVCDLYDGSQAKQSGSTYPIIVAVCDANNRNVSAAGMVLTATGWGTSTPIYAPVPDAGNSNGNRTFHNTGGSFMWNLKTMGIAGGNYNMFFTISGDPTLHSAPFAVR